MIRFQRANHQSPRKWDLDTAPDLHGKRIRRRMETCRGRKRTVERVRRTEETLTENLCALRSRERFIFPDVNDNVYKIDGTQPVSLSFASTNIGSTSSDSPQTTILQNVGSAALSISVLGSGRNPALPPDMS